MKNILPSLLLAGVVAVLPGSAPAQDSGARDSAAPTAPQIADQLSACVAIKDDSARLACFDRAAGAFTLARTNHQLIVVDRTQARKTRQALFGLSLPKIHLFGSDEADSGEVEVRELRSTVAGTRNLGHDKWSWTLADGSTWQTTEPSNDAQFVKARDEIVIKSGILGSYVAKVSGQAYKVMRTR